MLIVFSFASGFRKMSFILVYVANAKKIAFQKYQKIVLALLRNPCAQDKFFLIASGADDTESIGIKKLA